MSLIFQTRDLYGGAIQVSLPQDAIDASDLRQVPDHQEVFLRPDTLTSIIFEINEYQTAATIESTLEHPVPTDASNDGSVELSANQAAAVFHFQDVVPDTDYISSAAIATTAIQLTQPSITNFAAYHSTGIIISPEIDRAAISTLPLAWQATPAQREYQTKAHQLLIRLKEYGTDLCVRVNVPLKEFDSAQSEAALKEFAAADLILQKIVESFHVQDFGLFGTDP